MSRLMLVCTACQKPLSNATDTFGDVGCPFCWQCYGALITETDRTPLNNISSIRTFEGEYIAYYQPLRGWDQA